jgi:hypothetical protein
MYRFAMELKLLWLEILAALAFRSWEAAHNRAMYYSRAADQTEADANASRAEYEERARDAHIQSIMCGRPRRCEIRQRTR